MCCGYLCFLAMVWKIERVLVEHGNGFVEVLDLIKTKRSVSLRYSKII